MRRRTIALAVAMLAGAGVIGGVGATPAGAHGGTIQLGQNSATMNGNHTSLTVCDGEDDGNSVYAQVQYLWWGLPANYFDAYGSGCTPHSLSPRATQWRLCESGGTCSPWRMV